MLRLRAPSRLHFGLLQVPAAGTSPAAGERCYGGLGLMIDRPGVVVTWRPAELRRVEGRHAQRAQQFALRLEALLPEPLRQPYHLLVEQAPPEHIGLGTGTQLGLAVARILAVAAGLEQWPVTTLAAGIGRGQRSAVGVHGFVHGGLIAECGKTADEPVAPLQEHVALPSQWRVVLLWPVRPEEGSGWHGSREQAAFATAAASPAEPLRRLMREVIVPAARAGDFAVFAEAVHEYNRRAGEPFAAAQGGPYADPRIAACIAELRQRGIRGVGQSSWGPTVFALLPDEESARALARRYCPRWSIAIARVSRGHQLERLDDVDGSVSLAQPP